MSQHSIQDDLNPQKPSSPEQRNQLATLARQTKSQLSQTKQSHDETRRTFWNNLGTHQKKRFFQTRTTQLIAASALCFALALPFLGEQTKHTSLANPTESDIEQTSLIQLSLEITPNAEIMEPEILAFIYPETTENNFSNFINFVTEQEQS